MMGDPNRKGQEKQGKTVIFKNLTNVSCEYDRLNINSLNSTLQASLRGTSIIFHVSVTMCAKQKETLLLLLVRRFLFFSLPFCLGLQREK